MLTRAVRGRLREGLSGLLGPVLDIADERRRTSPATKLGLRRLEHDYRRLRDAGGPLPSVWDTGLRVFSELDEDGVILFLLATGGTGTHRFVDIGAGDGVTASNTANLALNLGLRGLHVDGDGLLARRGQRFYARHPDTAVWPPASVEAMVTPDNVDAIVGGAGFEGDIDLLSVDIDGNDFWIWKALRCVTPRVVVIEAHPFYGLEDWVMPYEEGFDAHAVPEGTRIGASPVAMTALAQELGYRLVGANRYGFNLFYAREDMAPAVPAISVEEVLRRTGAL
jgi:hypothetical protein